MIKSHSLEQLWQQIVPSAVPLFSAEGSIQSWPPKAVLAAFRVPWSHLPLHMSHVPDVSQACPELISFFYRASCNVLFLPVPQKLVQYLCSLPMAASTNYHELGGLKRLLSQFWRPELKSRCRQGCAPSKGSYIQAPLTVCVCVCLLCVCLLCVCLYMFSDSYNFKNKFFKYILFFSCFIS